jgi:hypothetical protein
MGKFDFLENLDEDLLKVDLGKKKEKVVYEMKGDIRIKRNGEISFSDSFRKKVGDKWVDFVFSKDWIQYPKDKPALCFINICDKGAALGDVKTEGTSVYIKERFLSKATELWGIDWDANGFIDFNVEPEGAEIKIALLPKIVARGEAKGAPTYVKRENAELLPIEPVEEDDDITDVIPSLDADTEEDED